MLHYVSCHVCITISCECWRALVNNIFNWILINYTQSTRRFVQICLAGHTRIEKVCASMFIHSIIKPGFVCLLFHKHLPLLLLPFRVFFFVFLPVHVENQQKNFLVFSWKVWSKILWRCNFFFYFCMRRMTDTKREPRRKCQQKVTEILINNSIHIFNLLLHENIFANLLRISAES